MCAVSVTSFVSPHTHTNNLWSQTTPAEAIQELFCLWLERTYVFARLCIETARSLARKNRIVWCLEILFLISLSCTLSITLPPFNTISFSSSSPWSGSGRKGCDGGRRGCDGDTSGYCDGDRTSSACGASTLTNDEGNGGTTSSACGASTLSCASSLLLKTHLLRERWPFLVLLLRLIDKNLQSARLLSGLLSEAASLFSAVFESGVTCGQSNTVVRKKPGHPRKILFLRACAQNNTYLTRRRRTQSALARDATEKGKEKGQENYKFHFGVCCFGEVVNMGRSASLLASKVSKGKDAEADTHVFVCRWIG